MYEARQAAHEASGELRSDLVMMTASADETLVERLARWPEKYPDVRVNREVVRDNPSQALLRHAEHARLVVVGTRGRGARRTVPRDPQSGRAPGLAESIPGVRLLVLENGGGHLMLGEDAEVAVEALLQSTSD